MFAHKVIETFLKVSSFVFPRRINQIQVLNEVRVNHVKWQNSWQSHFSNKELTALQLKVSELKLAVYCHSFHNYTNLNQILLSLHLLYKIRLVISVYGDVVLINAEQPTAHRQQVLDTVHPFFRVPLYSLETWGNTLVSCSSVHMDGNPQFVHSPSVVPTKLMAGVLVWQLALCSKRSSLNRN